MRFLIVSLVVVFSVSAQDLFDLTPVFSHMDTVREKEIPASEFFDSTTMETIRTEARIEAIQDKWNPEMITDGRELFLVLTNADRTVLMARRYEPSESCNVVIKAHFPKAR